MQIENGVLINAAWTPYIAVSTNGVDWTLIPKAGLKIDGQLSRTNTTSPLVNRPVQTRISLKSHNDRHPLVEFDAQDVTNKPTWNAGTQAALNIATDEIGTW